MSQHKQIRHSHCHRPLLACALLTLIITSNAQGQTSGFTYQGRLTDSGNPATNIYDFQFNLFDTADVGTGMQQGPTINLPSVQVTNGVFTVDLDFGPGLFNGSARFLEISLRPAGSADPYTELSPRQPIRSSPYALRSATAGEADTALNATQLGGLTSTGFIQNSTSQQSATNFNIGGTGTAGILNASTQFNLNGNRILSNAGTENLFAGVGAGTSSTTSFFNAFFGTNAGPNNTGHENSFFGTRAGRNNTTAGQNSFFGAHVGASTTTGSFNSFFGTGAGGGNTTGASNAFFGRSAGSNNTTGSNNTVIGAVANVGFGALNFATAIGAGAVVESSNTVVLGRSADTVQVPGLLYVGNSGPNVSIGNVGCGSFFAIDFHSSSSGCTRYALLGGDGNTYINRPTGGAIIFREGNGSNQVEIRPGGFFAIASLGGGGSTSLCRNGIAEIATCSSSLRYKTDIRPFFRGLDLIKRLRPITFTWKQDGMRDVGFGAEDVALIEPLLITHNDKGEVEGVKYDRITVAIVNAVREQQTQINQQQGQIKEQQAQIEALKKRQQVLDELKSLVCADRPDASICKSN